MQDKPKILFEFTTSNPKLMHYRGIKVFDGTFRMEKKSDKAKNFRAINWSRSESGLREIRDEIIEAAQEWPAERLRK